MIPASRYTWGSGAAVIPSWTRSGAPATALLSWTKCSPGISPAPAGRSSVMPASRALPLRAALYARVSLDDDRQTPESQLLQLREFAAAKGWTVVVERSDRAGADDLKGRVWWRSLLADARQGKFDLLVVWSLDRAFRSTLDALKTLEMLNHEGVGFICQRQAFDTTSPSGRLLFTVLAAVAEIERDLIRERTVAGIARARAQGKRLGRPPGSPGFPRGGRSRPTTGSSIR